MQFISFNTRRPLIFGRACPCWTASGGDAIPLLTVTVVPNHFFILLPRIMLYCNAVKAGYLRRLLSTDVIFELPPLDISDRIALARSAVPMSDGGPASR